MDDLISRQAAIDEAKKRHDFFRGATTPADKARRDELLEMTVWLSELPSAQPEIIRCKDCKYAKWDDESGDYICNGRAVWENHYCGYAKKKGEENDIV